MWSHAEFVPFDYTGRTGTMLCNYLVLIMSVWGQSETSRPRRRHNEDSIRMGAARIRKPYSGQFRHPPWPDAHAQILCMYYTVVACVNAANKIKDKIYNVLLLSCFHLSQMVEARTNLCSNMPSQTNATKSSDRSVDARNLPHDFE